MNRRKKITREDSTRWNYGYNDKGEVTSGIRERTAAPNAAVPGWNHGYSFDEIGNRLATTTNGRASTYTPNNLNQITTRTVPRAFDVIGKAATTAAVTVNTLATTRLDEYFYKEIPAGSGAVHVPYSVAATDGTGSTTRSAGKFLPATPETSTYDFDGNLTADGRFTYTWDAENRLIAMETLATVPVIARRKLAFAYDAMGRRIRKTTWNGTSTGSWQPNFDLRFLHEPGGWNILAEITADSKFLRTYTWGTDLSGGLSAAGGVGGLVFTKILPDNSIHANGMDLNGNVTLLVSTTTGQATATYDYGPFGEPIRESGEYAKLNPYRFSTKYADDETGLMDYGHRYYGALDGRWKSRDPIEEKGGENLYGFAGNDGIDQIDLLGKRNYAKGDGDPTIIPDLGAGKWGGTPATIKFRSIKLALQAGGVFFQWPNANDHLGHYLGNSGSKYQAKLENMVNAVPSAKRVFDVEVSQAMRFAENLTSPGKIYSRNGSLGYNAKAESKDWYYAIGGYWAWGKADVSCASGGSYEMIFEYKFQDEYNWDGGKSVKINVPGYGPITVTDHFMGELHRQGLAKEYRINGGFRKKVVWKKGGIPTITDLPPGGR